MKHKKTPTHPASRVGGVFALLFPSFGYEKPLNRHTPVKRNGKKTKKRPNPTKKK